MVQLYLRGSPVSTVFDLLGDKEIDVTYSLGWGLAQSPAFLRRLLKDLFPHRKTGTIVSINLQMPHSSKGGYTDIEVRTERLHVIIEAKRRWNLPTEPQLSRYARRFNNESNNALVVISRLSPAQASRQLPKPTRALPVQYRSWQQVIRIARRGMSTHSHAEKRILRELATYLEEQMEQQKEESNRVYVIALGNEFYDWAGMTWAEYVIDNRLFFQTLDSTRRWPKEPPNYLGFRHEGKLCSIHHVDKYEIVQPLYKHIRVCRREAWMNGAARLCRLGPPIKPTQDVKTGRLYRGVRVWAAIDLLLTSRSIAAARDKTNRRSPE